MGIPSQPLPTLAQVNATEDPKTRNVLAELQAILTGNVDSSNLAANAVSNSKLAADAVDASKIADGSVGTAELAANAVTAAKIASSVGLVTTGGTPLKLKTFTSVSAHPGSGWATISFGIGVTDAVFVMAIPSPQSNGAAMEPGAWSFGSFNANSCSMFIYSSIAQNFAAYGIALTP